MTAGMRRVYPEEVRLSEEDQAKVDELAQRYNALCDEDDRENSDEIAAKLQTLDAEMDALTGGEQYRPADIAIAGVFVCLDHHGELRIERGFVRAEDWKTRASADDDAEPSADGETDKMDNGKALSQKLVAELTAYRTAGLRNALAQHSATALTAMVHTFAAATFYGAVTAPPALNSRRFRLRCRHTLPVSTNASPWLPLRSGTHRGNGVCRKTRRRCGSSWRGWIWPSR